MLVGARPAASISRTSAQTSRGRTTRIFMPPAPAVWRGRRPERCKGTRHLQQSYATAVGAVQLTRAARANAMIFLFTAFGVVASAVAIVQYTAGDHRLSASRSR
mgnify:CR=1 FL=1